LREARLDEDREAMTIPAKAARSRYPVVLEGELGEPLSRWLVIPDHRLIDVPELEDVG
jgi:hypothetical protein